MNKNQKIIITIMLFLMAFILIYPPVSTPLIGESMWLPNGRYFLFSFAVKQYKSQWYQSEIPKEHTVQIDVKRLTIELLLIICLGGAMAILSGLEKEKERWERMKMNKGQRITLAIMLFCIAGIIGFSGKGYHWSWDDIFTTVALGMGVFILLGLKKRK